MMGSQAQIIQPDGADLTPKARRTRASLLAAAAQVIGRDGVSAVNVKLVCARAGVGRTSFYTYFEDVDALISAVAMAAAHRIRDEFNHLHQDMPRGAGRLQACLAMVLELAISEPDTMLLLTSLAQTSPDLTGVLQGEISTELAAEPTIAAEETDALAQYLAFAVLALTRQLAQGVIPPHGKDRQLAFLMRACRPG